MSSGNVAPRRRKFNMAAAKSAIVACVSCALSFLCSLTGLALQPPLTSCLRWMLGFSSPKATATATLAMGLSTFAAALAFVAQLAGHSAAPGYTALSFAEHGTILMVSAIAGVLAAMPLSRAGKRTDTRRLFHMLGVGLTSVVLFQAAHQSVFNAPHTGGVGVLRFAATGFGASWLNAVLGLPGGLSIVPALYYLAGVPANQSVALSLLVIGLGCVPAMVISSKSGLGDRQITKWCSFGAALGGLFAAMLLWRLDPKAVMLIFAALGIFLCAREVAMSVSSGGVASDPAS
ncbi:MAG TPA: sulfite exporter TauE/SafE family protein [Chthonomonadales bacterium]|nr:sulfite exporter TauE/SafE family protein [Chthonomonadales bacterium]